MMGIENYFGFIISGIFLNITPGADTILIITRSISNGKNAGNHTVFGIITGAFLHTFFVAYGVSVIIVNSTIAYSIIKYFGVLYLIYLGINSLKTSKIEFSTSFAITEKTSNFQYFKQGFYSNILNPKVALFYLSFLPQFVVPNNQYGSIPFLILGLTFIFTGSIWCFSLVRFSSLFAEKLRSKLYFRNIFQWLTAGVFFSIAILILVK